MPMATSSGFERSPGSSLSGNAPRVVPLHCHGHVVVNKKQIRVTNMFISMLLTYSYKMGVHRWWWMPFWPTNFLPFFTIGISMYQQIILPYTLFPTYLPQAYSLLERSTRRTEKILHPLFPKSYFFSLSVWGRNSTGLAELWGGWWLMEQDFILENLSESIRIACHFCHAVTHISPFTLPTHKY